MSNDDFTPTDWSTRITTLERKALTLDGLERGQNSLALLGFVSSVFQLLFAAIVICSLLWGYRTYKSYENKLNLAEIALRLENDRVNGLDNELKVLKTKLAKIHGTGDLP